MWIQVIIPRSNRIRDQLVEKLGVQLIVGSVQESIDTGRVAEEKGKMQHETHFRSQPCWTP